jgi:hypothetical protein
MKLFSTQGRNTLRPSQQRFSIRLPNLLAHLCARRPKFKLDQPQQDKGFPFLAADLYIGARREDCENAAAKRWLSEYGSNTANTGCRP